MTIEISEIGKGRYKNKYIKLTKWLTTHYYLLPASKGKLIEGGYKEGTSRHVATNQIV